MAPSSRPHMEDLSPADLRLYNPENPIDCPAWSRFFVMKFDDDPLIHWSIKYKACTSTVQGSKKLDCAFKVTEWTKGRVFLIFSVHGSSHFHGIAEMTSSVDYSVSIDDQRELAGLFDVRWMYVKDVPNTELAHIPLKAGGKGLTTSTDCEEVTFEGGMKVLQIFHVYKHHSSVFDDWGYYEKKEQERRRRFSGETEE